MGLPNAQPEAAMTAIAPRASAIGGAIVHSPIASTAAGAVYVATVCLIATSTSCAQSSEFSCPKAGVTVTYKVPSSGVEWTDTYLGADSDDPVVCRLTGPTPTRSSGEHRMLFNYFFLTLDQSGVVESSELRAALKLLFSGQKNQVTFSYGAYTPWRPKGPYRFEDTWTRLRRETIQIGGHDISADLIEQKSQRQGGNTTTARLWFDHESGVFIKIEGTDGIALSYIPSFSNQAISIIVPGQ
jgi:hypothetical protein